MFRKTSGSALCRACGKLNRVDAAVCFYCGARRPALWGFAPALRRVLGRADVARLVTLACGVLFAAALLLDPAAAASPRGPFSLLAPSGRALDALGMTGAYAWAQGRWWTLVTAIYLHGGLLHVAFNLLWIHQLVPVAEEAYGRSRVVVLFTVAGVAGFALSNALGVYASVGASGSVFGLLGALVRYGHARGGRFGAAVLRQYGHWALVLFVMGFLMPGVNNLAHGGGFAGGYVAAWILGASDAETPGHRLAAAAAVTLTAACFAMALARLLA